MRSYHFLSRYPDRNYQCKFLRWGKVIAYVVLFIGAFMAIYVGCGAEQSYGGAVNPAGYR